MEIPTNRDGRPPIQQEARELIAELEALREATERMHREHHVLLDRLANGMRESGENLIRYVAVRQHDVRQLQWRLHEIGVSSLGRMEAYVEASIDAVLRVLRFIIGEADASHAIGPRLSFREGRARLSEHAHALFGQLPESRQVSVMVTMPSDAAERPQLIRDLLAAGMNIMRINCAKDSPQQWEQMIDHLRVANSELGRPCKVFMDLAGPNPRTGPLPPRVTDVEFNPPTDRSGNVVEPVSVWVSSGSSAPREADAILPLEAPIVLQIKPQDSLVLRTGDEQVVVRILRREGSGRWGEAHSAGRFPTGTPVELVRNHSVIATTTLQPLPESLRAATYRVRPGDRIVLTSAEHVGSEAVRDAEGQVVEPARIGCTLPAMLKHAHLGQRVLYDDGDLEAVVKQQSDQELTVEVVRARKGSVKIKSGKGLNFPDTHAPLRSLTEKDLHDLEFVAAHADAVGFSFVREASDVQQLLDRLEELEAKNLGVVLKIETQDAFRNLPMLLLTAMQRSPVGVMVARGDMGAELGFGRMGEVQEEILWLCEAAHVPVIWATEVLDSLAKKGVPTRGDVTDAAMAGRAECVMLNKGEYIVEAVEFLVDILGRMGEHQRKKFARLRRLHVRLANAESSE